MWVASFARQTLWFAVSLSVFNCALASYRLPLQSQARQSTNRIPEAVTKRVASSDSLRSVLFEQPVPVIASTNDLQYMIEARVGDRERPVRLILDTGSPISWVDGSKSMDMCGTERVSDTIIKLDYGKGSVEGYEVQESFCMAGDLCIPKQVILCITRVEESLGGEDDIDGLMGLSFAWGDVGLRGGGILDNLERVDTPNGTLQFQHLAFRLRLSTHEDPRGSEIVFGDLIELLPAGSSGAMEVVPLRGDFLYWQVWAEVKTGSTAWDAVVILDSGTSVLAAPEHFQRELLKHLVGYWNLLNPFRCFSWSGLYDCSQHVHIGSLDFDFKGVPINLGPDDLCVYYDAGFFFGGRRCIITLSAVDLPCASLAGQCLLGGDTLLRKMDLVHDVVNREVHVFPRTTVYLASTLVSPPQLLGTWPTYILFLATLIVVGVSALWGMVLCFRRSSMSHQPAVLLEPLVS